MTGELRFKIKDYGGETSVHAVDIPDLTAANFDAIVTTQVAAYYNAMNDICIGNISTEVITARNILISEANAGSVNAQVELRWFIPYTDNVTGKKYGRTLACPDLQMLAAGSDKMNMSNAFSIAFKDAFEDIVRAPDTGNAVTMGVPYVVGRNS